MEVYTLRKGDKVCHLSVSIKQHLGFTLLELIITLTVIAISTSLIHGVSASIINSSKLAVTVNKVTADMAYARSEAVSRGQNIELCKSLNGIECIRSRQWESGWMVFVDNNRNRQRELSEQVLRYQPAIHTINITYRGSGSSHYIRYRADGATGVNGTFTFCSDKTGQYKKALILYRTGRLRLSSQRPGGKTISCSSYRD
ncbi:GspH/FimT family pseudopilin [Beggiatoa alba]|nr:GspH/FimT family pseudopilin [Beggiatoa alba]